MKVISAVMQKGGAGKTSAIVPLSWIAHEGGARVVLIDLDGGELAGSASQWAEAAGLVGERYVVSGVRVAQVPELVSGLRESGQVDYVFIDTSPNDKYAMTEVMSESDLCLLPMHIGSGDIAQLVETYQLLRRPMRHNPSLEHLIVLNHGGTMPLVTRQTREAVGQILPEARFAQTVIPYRREFVVAKGRVPRVGGSVQHTLDRSGGVIVSADGLESILKMAEQASREHKGSTEARVVFSSRAKPSLLKDLDMLVAEVKASGHRCTREYVIEGLLQELNTPLIVNRIREKILKGEIK